MARRMLDGLVRLIDIRKRGDRANAETMVELGEVSGLTGDAGAVQTCTVDGDDSALVHEPYGLASHAPSGDALLLAPGGDSDDLVALVSSVSGRPATEAGDVIVWSVGGHLIHLDADGALVVTARPSAAVTINAGAGASVTINVDPGQSVNIGGTPAAALALGQKVIDAVDAMLAGGVPVFGDGGTNLKATMITAWNLVKATILAQKAKGV